MAGEVGGDAASDEGSDEVGGERGSGREAAFKIYVSRSSGGCY